MFPLAGAWTLHAFSEHVAQLPLFEQEPAQHAYLDYRRWSYESAALDLALRQAGLSLGEAVAREPRPVAFVVSMGLGEPPSTERFSTWLDLYPSLRFKLDPHTHAILMDEIDRFKHSPETPPSPRAKAVVEDLSGWPHEQLWGNNPVAKAK